MVYAEKKNRHIFHTIVDDFFFLRFLAFNTEKNGHEFKGRKAAYMETNKPKQLSRKKKFNEYLF